MKAFSPLIRGGMAESVKMAVRKAENQVIKSGTSGRVRGGGVHLAMSYWMDR